MLFKNENIGGTRRLDGETNGLEARGRRVGPFHYFGLFITGTCALLLNKTTCISFDKRSFFYNNFVKFVSWKREKIRRKERKICNEIINVIKKWK